MNRHANSQTFLPALHDEQALDTHTENAKHVDEYKSIVHLDSKFTGGKCINIIMSVEAGHSPIIRVYAQYW